MKHIAKILIFAMLLSLFCMGGAALAEDEYTGAWRYDSYYLWYYFNGDGTWEEYTDDGLIMDGYCEVTDDTMYLRLPDDTVYHAMELDDGSMTDEDGDTLFPGELPDLSGTDIEAAGAVGVWECGDSDYPGWILLYPGYTYAAYDEDGLLSLGYTRVDALGRILLLESSSDDDSDALVTLTWMEGDLMADTGEYFSLGLLPFAYDTALYAATLDSPYISADYVGVWEYDDYYLWIEVNRDFTWSVYSRDGLLSGGSCYSGDECVYLNRSDGTTYSIISLNGNVMTDSDGDTLFRSELPDF